MKVLALGGSGGMGRHAVETALTFDGIEQIIVADINEEAANSYANSLPEKVVGIGLDVADRSKLTETMLNVDVVLNTVGPFFKYGPPVLEAAIESGCHYLDINDDWEPTLDMLKMHEKAKEKGITAIIGMGASPGLTNMLARVAMQQLDTVDTVYTGWSLAGASPDAESSQSGANAAMEHGILQVTGKVMIRQNGKDKMVKPLKEVEVTFPGSKPTKSHIFGHPEAVTFPHHFKEIKNSTNLAHGDVSVLKIIAFFVNLKILPAYQAARLLGYLERKIEGSQQKDVLRGGHNLPSVYGMAIGTKDGEKASAGATFSTEEKTSSTSMGEVTGIPLACGLKLLLDGKIKDRGVFAPEGAIEPNDFFDVFRDTDLAEDLGNDDLINIYNSWQNNS
jgi:saccharopine dehydrogenase-like NADP-dependent oxidoreductase